MVITEEEWNDGKIDPHARWKIAIMEFFQANSKYGYTYDEIYDALEAKRSRFVYEYGDPTNSERMHKHFQHALDELLKNEIELQTIDFGKGQIKQTCYRTKLQRS